MVGWVLPGEPSAAHQRLTMRSILLLLALTASSTAADAAVAEERREPFDDLRLEVHGFVSFGYLQSWENDWLDETTDGSADFHEAALNLISRPFDRIRLGAQLFERDLGVYDNGRVDLDWAYAAWQVGDELELAAGRLRTPLGLYNDVRDVDAARAPVFLPRSVYALRFRDLYVSIDGAAAKGLIDLAGDMDLEYALYGGDKRIADDTGTTTYLGAAGYGEGVTVDVDWTIGGMAHLTTSVPGLGFRISVLRVDALRIAGDPTPGIELASDLDYWLFIGSVEYDLRAVTLAAEYSRLRGRGSRGIAALGVSESTQDDGEGMYVSATWRQKRWLEWYLAGEAEFDDATDRDRSHAWRLIAATAVRPMAHWSLKLEAHYADETLETIQVENPDGAEHHWWGVALKTTVDF